MYKYKYLIGWKGLEKIVFSSRTDVLGFLEVYCMYRAHFWCKGAVTLVKSWQNLETENAICLFSIL